MKMIVSLLVVIPLPIGLWGRQNSFIKAEWKYSKWIFQWCLLYHFLPAIGNKESHAAKLYRAAQTEPCLRWQRSFTALGPFCTSGGTVLVIMVVVHHLSDKTAQHAKCYWQEDEADRLLWGLSGWPFLKKAWPIFKGLFLPGKYRNLLPQYFPFLWVHATFFSERNDIPLIQEWWDLWSLNSAM